MDHSASINNTRIQRWITDNLDTQKIVEELHALGYDVDAIDAHLKEYKKIKFAKRQNMGFVLMAVGSIIGFVSCVLSLLNPFPELYYWFLYGLTSFAVVIVVAGLYFLLE